MNDLISLLQRSGITPALHGHSPNFRQLVEYLLCASYEEGLMPGVSPVDIFTVARLSVYHDIGKAAIPAAILDKPGKLTEAERRVLQSHTTEGCRLLEALPAIHGHPIYPMLYDICRHHHERWDGGGYPDGLGGESLSLWVQVLGLADAYDALVTERCYRKAMPHPAAAALILSGGCGVFAPALLECFRAYAPYLPQTVYGEVGKSA